MTRDEIIEKARELCKENNTECALFISGYVRGYEDALKDFENKK